jgi:hypothetical protein
MGHWQRPAPVVATGAVAAALAATPPICVRRGAHFWRQDSPARDIPRRMFWGD